MLLQLFSRKLWRMLGLTLLVAVGVCGSAAPLRSAHAASDLFGIPAGTGIGSQSDPIDLVGALAAAAPGDTIYLGAGTYTGSGTAIVSLTTSVNLLGGWDGALTGPVVRDPAAFVSTLDGEDARQVLRITGGAAPTIDGLTITGGLADDGSGGGIYISGSSAAEIRQNQIISNESGWGAGIYRDGTQTSTIREI
jgi:nitrous oxidase accessory protein NosD